ncbi:MAG TPA: alpha/beta hydrolase [Candidatus Acidoferrales bacterium]|nr:alpha/beta hydrolase [Candidatus Acidoferrales bacterium]
MLARKEMHSANRIAVSRHWIRPLVLLAAVAAFWGYAGAQQQPFVQISGAPCAKPPVLHCPDTDCTGDREINQGPVVEMKTRRPYFLDYPCDLKPGEQVTFILSIHGAGSYGNWQRHYFPILDYVDKYRLVVATPNSPTRVWSTADDEYLQNIVNFVVEQIGKQNIKAFWLAGHSQGGMTSNRLLRTDFFAKRVDGWLSLSGGRLAPAPTINPTFFTAVRPAPGAPPPPGPGALSAAMAALKDPPAADFSFIFETGRHEMDDKGLPAASEWATKYGCGARAHVTDIVDAKPGYVWDPTRQNPGSDAWGHQPKPGTADVMAYPNCKDGRIVADVVRADKGHTEGLEPKITEELIQLMLSAKGGKIQQMQ